MNKQLFLDIKLRDEATFDNYVGAAPELIKQYHAWSFVWGGPGSGRSHLLQACCHHFDTSIYLSELDQLSPDVLVGLETMAVICIDDIESVLDDERWQESLFHLMNAVKDNHHRIIVAAQKPAQLLSVDLKDLHSRLIAATSIRTDELSDEEKLIVLMMRAKNRGFQIGEDVGRYILSRSGRHMSDILDLLVRLEVETLRHNKRVTIPFVKQVLGL